MGLVKLGFTASYLSDPVVSGFTTGSAVVIVLSQVKHILGLKIPHFTGLFSVVKVWGINQRRPVQDTSVSDCVYTVPVEILSGRK